MQRRRCKQRKRKFCASHLEIICFLSSVPIQLRLQLCPSFSESSTWLHKSTERSSAKPIEAAAFVVCDTKRERRKDKIETRLVHAVHSDWNWYYHCEQDSLFHVHRSCRSISHHRNYSMCASIHRPARRKPVQNPAATLSGMFLVVRVMMRLGEMRKWVCWKRSTHPLIAHYHHSRVIRMHHKWTSKKWINGGGHSQAHPRQPQLWCCRPAEEAEHSA